MSNGHKPAAEISEAATRGRPKLAAVVLTFAMLTTYNGVIPIFSTRICQYFSLSVEQYGTMIGLGSLGQMISLVLVGLMIARFGVRRIAEYSLVGIGACFMFIGLGASLSSLKYSIAIHGFFAGLFKVAMPAFLIALYPTLKRRMVSVHLVAFSAAGIVVPFWANQLLKGSEGGGDRAFASVFFMPFLIVGCILIAGGVVLGLNRQPRLEGPQEATSGTRFVRELFEFRSLTIVALVALHASADNTLYQFLPMFMEHHFDELPLAPAWALSGHAIAYVTTRFLLSLLPEGVGQRAILTLAGPIGGLIILAMLWQRHAVSIPLLYTLASLFYAAEFPVLVSEISSRSMGQFGTILAGGFLAANAGNFALLKGTGRLVDTTNDYRLSLSVAACGFIAFGVIAAATGLGKSLPSRSKMDPE